METLPVSSGEVIRIVGKFQYKGDDYTVCEVGKPLKNCLYFPSIYIVNKTKSEVNFLCDIMKFGVSDFRYDNDKSVIDIYGYSCGQCNQWERYSIDGDFIESF